MTRCTSLTQSKKCEDWRKYRQTYPRSADSLQELIQLHDRIQGLVRIRNAHYLNNDSQENEEAQNTNHREGLE